MWHKDKDKYSTVSFMAHSKCLMDVIFQGLSFWFGKWLCGHIVFGLVGHRNGHSFLSSVITRDITIAIAEHPNMIQAQLVLQPAIALLSGICPGIEIFTPKHRMGIKQFIRLFYCLQSCIFILDTFIQSYLATMVKYICGLQSQQ